VKSGAARSLCRLLLVPLTGWWFLLQYLPPQTSDQGPSHVQWLPHRMSAGVTRSTFGNVSERPACRAGAGRQAARDWWCWRLPPSSLLLGSAVVEGTAHHGRRVPLAHHLRARAASSARGRSGTEQRLAVLAVLSYLAAPPPPPPRDPHMPRPPSIHAHRYVHTTPRPPVAPPPRPPGRAGRLPPAQPGRWE
jgi:hypothetical protein